MHRRKTIESRLNWRLSSNKIVSQEAKTPPGTPFVFDKNLRREEKNILRGLKLK